jgi:hypothetical protein
MSSLVTRWHESNLFPSKHLQPQRCFLYVPCVYLHMQGAGCMCSCVWLHVRVREQLKCLSSGNLCTVCWHWNLRWAATEQARLAGQWASGFSLTLLLRCWHYRTKKSPHLNFCILFLTRVLGTETWPLSLKVKHFTNEEQFSSPTLIFLRN